MIAYLLAGVMIFSHAPVSGAIVPYISDDVCDANGDCDDDNQCFAFGGACYTDFDAACWEEDGR
jgi:hypothetical protein